MTKAPRKAMKYCHDCRFFIPLDDPSADPECELAVEKAGLAAYPLLRTVKFQRASGFITDCGPGARNFEPRGG